MNGGLSKEAMTLLRDIFDFDYMGSAEFEYGIVPSCLSFLAENHDKLVKGKITLPKKGPVIYYLCHKDHQPQIGDHLKLLATNPPRSKERIGLKEHFEPNPSKYDLRTVGWLDCSNGFLFFVDEEMWEKTCKLFGV